MPSTGKHCELFERQQSHISNVSNNAPSEYSDDNFEQNPVFVTGRDTELQTFNNYSKSRPVSMYSSYDPNGSPTSKTVTFYNPAADAPADNYTDTSNADDTNKCYGQNAALKHTPNLSYSKTSINGSMQNVSNHNAGSRPIIARRNTKRSHDQSFSSMDNLDEENNSQYNFQQQSRQSRSSSSLLNNCLPERYEKQHILGNRYGSRQSMYNAPSNQRLQVFASVPRPVLSNRQRASSNASILSENANAYDNSTRTYSTPYEQNNCQDLDNPIEEIPNLINSQVLLHRSNTGVNRLVYSQEQLDYDPQMNNIQPRSRANSRDVLNSARSETDILYEQVAEQNPVHPNKCNANEKSPVCDMTFRFYRNGFRVLVLLNVIMIVIGVTLLVQQIVKQSGERYVITSTETSRPDAFHSRLDGIFRCVDGIALKRTVGDNVFTLGKDKGLFVCPTVNDDTQVQNCCFNSVLDLLQFLKTCNNSIGTLLDIPEVRCPPKQLESIPLARLRPDIKSQIQPVTVMNDESYGNFTTIFWNAEKKAIRHIKLLQNGAFIQITKAGHYFLYSRIHYRKDREPPTGEKETNEIEFIEVGHNITKVVPKGQDEVLDYVSEKCVLGIDKVEHTSVLQTIVHLNETDMIYIRLDNTEYFDQLSKLHNSLGLFFISE